MSQRFEFGLLLSQSSGSTESSSSSSSSLRHDASWESRKHTIEQIEETILEVVDLISKDQLPVFSRSLSDPRTGEVRKSCIRLSNSYSRKKFAVVMQILTRAHQLLQTGTTLTHRDLYYEDETFYGCQRIVDEAINDISLILQVPQTWLPFESTVKGVMGAGEKTKLTWLDSQGIQISVVLSKTGNLIPNQSTLHSWGKFESNAKFILIVEKDAIFQRLVEEDIFDKFEPFILITGKGYPDKATRRLACKLSTDLVIPTFALVDANPYGLDIAVVYKWGAEKQKDMPDGNANIIVPDLILLGLLPSDLGRLAIEVTSSQQFNDRDKHRLSSIKKRIVKFQNESDKHVEPIWIREIEAMEASQRKAEIEAVAKIGNKFLTDAYLRGRIREYFQSLSHSQNHQFMQFSSQSSQLVQLPSFYQ